MLKSRLPILNTFIWAVGRAPSNSVSPFPAALIHLSKSARGSGHCVPTPSRGQWASAMASHGTRRGARAGLCSEFVWGSAKVHYTATSYRPRSQDIPSTVLRPHSPAATQSLTPQGGRLPLPLPPDLLPLPAPFFRSPWRLFPWPAPPFVPPRAFPCVEFRCPFAASLPRSHSSFPGALFRGPAGAGPRSRKSRAAAGLGRQTLPWVVSEPGVNGPAWRFRFWDTELRTGPAKPADCIYFSGILSTWEEWRAEEAGLGHFETEGERKVPKAFTS